MNVLFAGDLHIDSADIDICSEYLKIVGVADLSLVSLEAPLTASTKPILKSGPNLKIRTDVADRLLKSLPFSLYSCANNHIGDFGEEGVLETMVFLKQRKKAFLGAGKNVQEARKPFLFEKDGQKIAILAMVENEFGVATECQAGSNGFDPIKDVLGIRELASQGYLVMVYFHGGTEFFPLPNPFVIRTFKGFIDAGARIVVGSHTHCPLGYESYKDGLIFYGMGNFMFNKPAQKTTLELRAKRLIKEKILHRKNDNTFWNYGYSVSLAIEANTMKFQIIPTYCENGALTIPKGKIKERYLAYLDRISALIKSEVEYARYWSAWVWSRQQHMKTWIRDSKYLQNSNPAKFRRALGFKNMFTCESHREVTVSSYHLDVGADFKKDYLKVKILRDSEAQLKTKA
ncbi:MAG: Capsule biosynthesis protein CapA [Syntrophorhabdus sp. PtaB.Bin006]|nr:MAG: Capsule biosynthesis protein CapA [Syntrophorhabdus sp. PtaB.Bin006]